MYALISINAIMVPSENWAAESNTVTTKSSLGVYCHTSTHGCMDACHSLLLEGTFEIFFRLLEGHLDTNCRPLMPYGPTGEETIYLFT